MGIYVSQQSNRGYWLYVNFTIDSRLLVYVLIKLPFPQY